MPSYKSPGEKENIKIDSHSFHLDEDGSTVLRVSTAHGYFGGEIKDDTPEVMEPLVLWVDPEHRGNGIGEKLVAQLVNDAKGHDVRTIRGHIESQHALDIRARIFGRESMRFFHDKPTGNREEVPEQYKELPITFKQARGSLERAEQHEKHADNRKIGFVVEQDIE